MANDNRAGRFIRSDSGYQAFMPMKLPPVPPIRMDAEMTNLLSIADRKLGRLDGITQVLPNPELFVTMYVKKEALLSSQIEGTQASFAEVLNAEHDINQERKDVREVVNYVDAMSWGLEELDRFPLSLRLIRNIHKRLLKNTRGSQRSPGEFRTTQNWIGPPGCTIATATFVPPTVPDMQQAMGDLELFMHEQDDIPALIKIALIHAQFETIHPFLDGNGRMGRLLITFWLCQQQILTKPLLYLSYYFKMHRSEYYDRLMDVRKKGDWESWIKFFLCGIAEVSDEATTSAKEILRMKEDFSKKLYQLGGNSGHYQLLLEKLFEHPYVSRSEVMTLLGVSNPTAGNIIEAFCNHGILTDMDSGKTRGKTYGFQDYLRILEKGTETERFL